MNAGARRVRRCATGRPIVRLDKSGPWADHARGQIRKLLDREKLSIAWRAKRFIAPHRGTARLRLVSAEDGKC